MPPPPPIFGAAPPFQGRPHQDPIPSPISYLLFPYPSLLHSRDIYTPTPHTHTLQQILTLILAAVSVCCYTAYRVRPSSDQLVLETLLRETAVHPSPRPKRELSRRGWQCATPPSIIPFPKTATTNTTASPCCIGSQPPGPGAGNQGKTPTHASGPIGTSWAWHWTTALGSGVVDSTLATPTGE